MRIFTSAKSHKLASRAPYFLLLLALLWNPNGVFAQAQRLIKIRNIATGFILEIPNLSPGTGGSSMNRNGMYCTERTDNNTANQQWTIGAQEYYNALTTTTPNYECRFINRNSGQFLCGDFVNWVNSGYTTFTAVQYTNYMQGSVDAGRWQLQSHYDANRSLYFFSIKNALAGINGNTDRLYLTPVSTASDSKLMLLQQSEADFLNNPLSQWEILDITDSFQNQTQPAPFLGTCTFTNPASNKVLQVYKQACDPGTGIEIGNYIGITSQQWVISNYGTNTPSINSPVKIINRLCNLALQVVGQSKADGALLEEGQFVGIASQLWIPIQVGSNWAFRNVNSGYVMQVVDGSTADGARIQQGNLVPVPQQIWAVNTVSNLRMQSPLATTTPQQKPAGIAVYPNPAKNSISIVATECTKICTISIVDAYGKTIQQLANFNRDEQLDISSLATGVYCLRVSDDSHSFTLKFAKE